MKLIFLDFDGVLNSSMWHAQRSQDDELTKLEFKDNRYHFDPDAVAQLNRVIDATAARLVISSSWRHHRPLRDLTELLGSVGVRGWVIGKTPDHVPGARERGHEIAWWLDATPYQVDAYAILDDDSDMAHLSDHLVHCNNLYGLRAQEADEVIKRLGAPRGQPYTLDEARLVAEQHKMDPYHRDLMKFLIAEAGGTR